MPRLRKVDGGNGHGNGPVAQDRSPEEDLRPFGLVPGDTVRWRPREGARWVEGRVLGTNKDGSLNLADARGASRAIVAGRCERKVRGPRGGVVWEPVEEP